ncbi:hypothetical protein [Lentzea guizhouensis]|nr:hypothetical protein [Lentzea guizhouensis]
MNFAQSGVDDHAGGAALGGVRGAAVAKIGQDARVDSGQSRSTHW